MRDGLNFVEIHIRGEAQIWREDKVEDALGGRATTFCETEE